MLNLCATSLFASSCFFSSAAAPAFEKAVVLSGALQPDAAQEGQYTITIRLEIGEGWHTYDDAGDGAQRSTSLSLDLPEGVTAVGGWNRPLGVEADDELSSLYYGRVVFTRTVMLAPGAKAKSIDVAVSYQACTESYCNRPKTETVSIALPGADAASGSVFDEPLRLMVDGAPLNAAAKERFPSPAIFDVDGDGQAELVIGGLMGSMGFYENLNASGTGEPVWGKKQRLNGADGQPIRASNW